MMILYGKEGLRNTLLYQNHARISNLGSNLFITYIWLVKSLILSLKITIFWTNSTLAHHFNMMLQFATKVFATSNYHKIMGFQMRYVWTRYTDLYIYFLNQMWNIWSKNSILQGFFGCYCTMAGQTICGKPVGTKSRYSPCPVNV